MSVRERKEPPVRYQHRRAFIVCRSALKEEEDTITDAAVYFYPKFEELEKSYVAVRCKQLVGVPEVLKDIGLGCPTIFNFSRGFTAIRSWGDYFVYLEGRFGETQEEVERVLDKMCLSFIHMRGSFDLLKRSEPNFNENIKAIWDSILAYYLNTLGQNERIFDQRQFADLRKKERNVCLLQAKQIIDHFVHCPDVITGAVFYHNKILYCDSNIEDCYPALLDNFAILADTPEDQCHLREIQLGDLLNNCKLYLFYLYKDRWGQLGGRGQVPVGGDGEEEMSILAETSLRGQEHRVLNHSESRISAQTIFSLQEDMGTRLGFKSVGDISTPIHEVPPSTEESVVTDTPIEAMPFAIDSLDPLTNESISDLTELPFSPAESMTSPSENDLGIPSKLQRFNSPQNLDKQYSEEILDASPVEELEVVDNVIRDDKYSTMRLATLKMREGWFQPPSDSGEGEHEPWLTEVCLLVVSVNKLKIFLITERNIHKNVPLLLEIREASVTSLNRLNAYVHNCILNPREGLSCKTLVFASHDAYDNEVVTSRDSSGGDMTFKYNVRQMQREFQKFPGLKSGSFTCRKIGFIGKKHESNTIYYQATKQLQKLFAERSIPHVDALMLIDSEGNGMIPNHHRIFKPSS